MRPLFRNELKSSKKKGTGYEGDAGGLGKEEETYIIKLFPQLLQVDNATPLALNEVGKTSAGKAHGTGPHVAPKASM